MTGYAYLILSRLVPTLTMGKILLTRFCASHRKRQSTPRRIYGSRRLPAWWLLMFSLVLRGDKHRRIKRSGVASEFAVHRAGEIDASDQVLSKSVVHAAQSDSLVAESKTS
jgi:hypothetical protein